MHSLYLHIPFCARRCGYCDFFSRVCAGVPDDYVRAAAREMVRERDFGGAGGLNTVYFGGGTPSLLSPGQLEEFFDSISRFWDLSALREVTLEANPDDLSPAYLSALRGMGFDRLSIGIQSLDDDLLKFMGRRHSAAAAIKAVRDAREAGFDNISTDLIYGIPGLDAKLWAQTLRRTLDLRPEHISAYCLSVEPGTPFARRGVEPADETVASEQYDTLRETLAGAGYERYEISNFALPGHRSRHNSAYWSGAPYLGIGPSAHSYDGERTRRWNAPSLEEYLAGPRYESEILSDTDLFNELLMTRLRTSDGVNEEELESRFGVEVARHFRRRAGELVRVGAMEHGDGKYMIPEQKWFVSDGIICSLFDK
jgi:oxygen-independent coproporphyrinogen-3 oxidase